MKKSFLLFALVLTVLLLCPALSSAASDPGNFVFDMCNGAVLIEKISETKNKVYYDQNAKRASVEVPVDKTITLIGRAREYHFSDKGFWTAQVLPKTNVTIKLNNTTIVGGERRGFATSYPALDIKGGCKVKLILADGTRNELYGPSGCPALRIEESSSLVISGNGTLLAEGGYSSAGIGGYTGNKSGSVTIDGGTITARGGDGGAGIGGGLNDDGGTIVINGGKISATSIGGGYRGASGNITVNGGTVKTGRIGADANGEAVGSVVINGGNIVQYGYINPQPKNAKGQFVYPATMVTNGGNEAIESLSTNYGLKDVVSDDRGKLCFFLPANAVDEVVRLGYAGNVYTARVNTNGTALFSMNKSITIDETRQRVRYYENPRFQVKSYPALDWFNVKYKKHASEGAVYDSRLGDEPGLYDVLVTRSRDSNFALFEKEIIAGLELLDSFTYTVRYYGNGATGGSTSDSTHTYGFEKELNPNGFTKTGYAFKGWDTNEAGKNVVYSDKQSVANLTKGGGSTVRLYAVWEAWQFDIDYFPGRYGKGPAGTDIKIGGVDLSLRGAIFTREGYAQTGWTQSDGGGKEYDLCGVYSREAPMDLYPVWEKTSVVILDANGKSTMCESLEHALSVVREKETIRLTDNCDFGAAITVPANTTLDLGGFGLKCAKLTVSTGANLIIGAGQTVDISPNGESDAPSRFTGLKIHGKVTNWGHITLNGAVVMGIGTIDMKAGYITFKGASSVYKIQLSEGVNIEVDESYIANGISGVIYLPKLCYYTGYKVLTGSVSLESYFSLGNPPDNGWIIGDDGRLISGISGAGSRKPVVIPEHLAICVGATVNVNNFFPDGVKSEIMLYADDEDVLRIVEKKGKQQLVGESVGETALKLIRDGIVYKIIPVAVVAKGQAADKLAGDGSITLRPGERKPLGITVKPDTALDKTLFYHVGNPEVAKVENGEIIGVGKGNCRITVVSTGAARKVIKVTVKKFAEIETAALSAIEITLKKGEKATLEAIITPADADQSVSWSSKNPKIAKVKGGVVTAKKPGETTIMCKLSNGEKIGCLVTVTQ